MKADQVLLGSPTFPLRFLTQFNQKRKLLVFLHGFKEQPRKLVMECDGAYLEQWDQIAYFAPFPVPRDEHFPPRKFCYSWYFDSLDKTNVIIPIDFSLGLIKLHLIEIAKNYDEVVIVGFSQGAMLGLPLAGYIPQLTKMISISAWPMQFISYFGAHRNFVVHAFHGNSDQVLSLKRAKEEYQELEQKFNLEVILTEYDGSHHVPVEMPKYLMRILN